MVWDLAFRSTCVIASQGLLIRFGAIGEKFAKVSTQRAIVEGVPPFLHHSHTNRTHRTHTTHVPISPVTVPKPMYICTVARCGKTWQNLPREKKNRGKKRKRHQMLE